MNIKTKATNIELSGAISDYLAKRLAKTEKFLGGVDPDSVMVEVELAKTTNHHKSGDIFKAEINFCIGGECYRAVSETADLYTSIDDARNELMRELRKRKRKKIWGVRKGGQRIKAIVKGLWRNNDESR
jgi:ribosomal subunit interface protein